MPIQIFDVWRRADDRAQHAMRVWCSATRLIPAIGAGQQHELRQQALEAAELAHAAFRFAIKGIELESAAMKLSWRPNVAQ